MAGIVPAVPRAAKKPDSSSGLKAYRARRDFGSTPEPAGRKRRTTRAQAKAFCVQKHLARTLHYDLRLEHRGVLLSWAVPKGPSLNPADKRRAVRTEDHPLDYGEFEGVIPAGYGAGVVLLWDRGKWRCDSEDADEALEKGELKFTLDGVKLKGSWVLVRTASGGEEGERQEQWLLIKHRDQWAGDLDISTFAPLSVKSFVDLAGVLAEGGLPAKWRGAPPVKSGETGELFRSVIREAAEREAERQPARRQRGEAARMPKSALTLGSRRPALSNLSKPLYASGFTKGQVIDYYTKIAPFILPHLRNRAITLKRYPDGADGKSFFEKRCPAHRPDWVATAAIEHASGKRIDYCLVNDLSTLVWVANLAALELHVPLALADEPEVATTMVFDLDPGEPATLADCIEIGLQLREMLSRLGLESFAKLSGKKGLHVYIPLNVPGVTFDRTKAFARAIALLMQRQDPKRITASMAKSGRGGKVYVDWAQNDVRKTTVGVYSLRAAETPRVSLPVSWDTLARERKRPGKLLLDAPAALAYVQRHSDLFVPVLTLRQRLPELT